MKEARLDLTQDEQNTYAEMATEREDHMTTETRTTTCGCGSILSETYPAAIKRHTDTAKHQAWVVAKYGDLAGAPVEPVNVQLVAARGPNEDAISYLARLEVELGAAYPAFSETDAGQAALREAAREAAIARHDAKKAEQKAMAEAAARRNAEYAAATHSGPVEIVKPPTNGKATKAARKAGVKDPPMDPITAGILASTKTGAARVNLGTGKVTVLPAPKSQAPKAKGGNAPLKLGDTPVEIDGVKYRPILHRDGSIALHQTDNYIFKCGTCGRRLRAAECVGPKDGPAHAAVKAPAGYRASERIVK